MQIQIKLNGIEMLVEEENAEQPAKKFKCHWKDVKKQLSI